MMGAALPSRLDRLVRVLVAGVIAAVLAGAAQPARAQAKLVDGGNALPRFTCNLKMPCWYLFYQRGAAPKRVLYAIDGRHAKVSKDVYQATVIVIPETPDAMDYWVFTVQFQATAEQAQAAQGPIATLEKTFAAVKLRQMKAYRVQTGGTLESDTKEYPWTALPKDWQALAFRIAVDPEAMEERAEQYDMISLANLYRPVDVVDLTRRVLPLVKEVR
jgi:hypothetical protein